MSAPSRPSFATVDEFKSWFESHVRLAGKPYTLDRDQARAVYDGHQNTLVTARAGSGKTRVIVAKIAYLVASGAAELDQIIAFMFNRTAAAEVNERIAAVTVDGVPLGRLHGDERPIRVASTFHKFALDTVKSLGERPEIVSELEHDALIRHATDRVLARHHSHLSRRELAEQLKLISSFVARAGQQYLGDDGLARLESDVEDYCTRHADAPDYCEHLRLHRLALEVYRTYLAALRFPKIDFNLLMARAAEVLDRDIKPAKALDRATERVEVPGNDTVNDDPSRRPLNPAQLRLAATKYILVDEYQDFSYLFYNLIRALRTNCPSAHLFAVGDDWQAINRFAGSDVDYFLRFADYFPDDTTNIPLMTNYRSDRRIVENANRYMLAHYNPAADRAVAFSRKSGRIRRLNPDKTKFDSSDLAEDRLHDAIYLLALAETCGGRPEDYLAPAKLLKALTRLARKHRRDGILLLHRHNFTSFPNVSLAGLHAALGRVLVAEGILTADEFATRVRCLTMHKSKGLESDVVVLLEANREQILASHPHATVFELFGDTLAAERADQHRLLYVALTRAKHRLYILSTDRESLL